MPLNDIFFETINAFAKSPFVEEWRHNAGEIRFIFALNFRGLYKNIVISSSLSAYLCSAHSVCKRAVFIRSKVFVDVPKDIGHWNWDVSIVMVFLVKLINCLLVLFSLFSFICRNQRKFNYFYIDIFQSFDIGLKKFTNTHTELYSLHKMS